MPAWLKKRQTVGYGRRGQGGWGGWGGWLAAEPDLNAVVAPESESSERREMMSCVREGARSLRQTWLRWRNGGLRVACGEEKW